MTIFDGKRLANIDLDFDGIRRGHYADKYFENITGLLTTLASESYTFAGTTTRDGNPRAYHTGDAVVEMQIFTRRAPHALIGGVDVALLLLQECTGYREDGKFVNMAHTLEVEAVEDGVLVDYHDDPLNVHPIMKIRGVYRYFAPLETVMLGYLTRISRVATNVYEILKAADGKPVLFFPARFDLPAVQAADGYAYWLAVNRFTHDSGKNVRPSVSTDAQGEWWGGKGGGTIPHALIAVFLADTAESMIHFARTQPTEVPRIALVDFDNDTITTALDVAQRMFEQYRAHFDDEATAKLYRLDGVRLDTAGNLVDKSLSEDPAHYGVNEHLVRAMRQALDNAWHGWDLPENWQAIAQRYCEAIKIVVTGGFTAEKIRHFEANNVPVDIYGVGSSLLRNDPHTNTDFTADVVRVKLDGQWMPMAKVGRQANNNPTLAHVRLS